jgi:arylsulfatase
MARRPTGGMHVTMERTEGAQCDLPTEMFASLARLSSSESPYWPPRDPPSPNPILRLPTKAPRLLAAQAIVGEFMATFAEFPPRQKAASFTIEQAHAKMGS